jgi:hypothetical protein
MYQEPGVFQEDLDKVVLLDKINPVKWITNFITKTLVITELEVR